MNDIERIEGLLAELAADIDSVTCEGDQSWVDGARHAAMLIERRLLGRAPEMGQRSLIQPPIDLAIWIAGRVGESAI